jgi:hypothetical protein
MRDRAAQVQGYVAVAPRRLNAAVSTAQVTVTVQVGPPTDKDW